MIVLPKEVKGLNAIQTAVSGLKKQSAYELESENSIKVLALLKKFVESKNISKDTIQSGRVVKTYQFIDDDINPTRGQYLTRIFDPKNNPEFKNLCDTFITRSKIKISTSCNLM